MRMIKREIPVIGISTEIDIPGRISVKRKYVDAVLQAGGIPFILPFTDNVQILQSVVSFIDGLLLTGGGDISPDRKSTRLNSSHDRQSRMPSSA